jgi:hypothetical protein
MESGNEDDDQRQQHQQSANSDEIIKHFEQLDDGCHAADNSDNNYDSYDDTANVESRVAAAKSLEGRKVRATSKADKEDGELDDDDEDDEAGTEDLIEYDTTFDLNPSVSAPNIDTKSEHAEEEAESLNLTTTRVAQADAPSLVGSTNLSKIDEDDEYQDYDDEEFEDTSTADTAAATATSAVSVSPPVDSVTNNTNSYTENISPTHNPDDSQKSSTNTVVQSLTVHDSVMVSLEAVSPSHDESAPAQITSQEEEMNDDVAADEDTDTETDDDDDAPFGNKRLKIDEGLTATNAVFGSSDASVAAASNNTTSGGSFASVTVHHPVQVTTTPVAGNSNSRSATTAATAYQLSPISSVDDPDEHEEEATATVLDESMNIKEPEAQDATVVERAQPPPTLVVDASPFSSKSEDKEEASGRAPIESVPTDELTPASSVRLTSEEPNSGKN